MPYLLVNRVEVTSHTIEFWALPQVGETILGGRLEVRDDVVVFLWDRE